MGFANKALLEEAIHEGDRHGQKEANEEQLGIEEEYLLVDDIRILEPENQISLRFDHQNELNRRDTESLVSKDVLVEAVHAKQSFHEVKQTLKKFKSCSLENVPAEKLESVRSARSWDEYHHRLDISNLREMKLGEKLKKIKMNKFMAMFEKLKAFKEEYRHTNVRRLQTSTPDVIALCHWCVRYRSVYHQLTNGIKPPFDGVLLTPEKFILLESIDFNWDSTVQDNVNLKKYQTEDESRYYFKKWLKTYTNLKNFLEVNGRYPYQASEEGTEEHFLNRWMKRQKHAYNHQGTTRVIMTQNRILKLMELSQWKFGIHAMEQNNSNC